MNRDAYLSQRDVAGFVEWAGHLVRGEWGLEHSWKGNGPPFRCRTLYEAFQAYLWPNRVDGDRFGDTTRKFDRFRQALNSALPIVTEADRNHFIVNARAVARWGGIRLSLKDWADMSPPRLQAFIDDVRSKLDPAVADTSDLRVVRYMSSGYSKIYAALIPGFPIYDSRVACALLCLVRLYRRDVGIDADVLPRLELGIPAWRATLAERCRSPQIYASAKYAKANLQFAWLMQGLTADPGEFAQIPAAHRVDALQSALFMLGYTRLADDAVVKSREGTPASAG